VGGCNARASTLLASPTGSSDLVLTAAQMGETYSALRAKGLDSELLLNCPVAPSSGRIRKTLLNFCNPKRHRAAGRLSKRIHAAQ
jgi:hypothetical protein